MEPLRITARLERGIASPVRLPRIDSLLAAVEAVYFLELDPPDPSKPTPFVSIDHVIERSPCGRYYRASFAEADVEEYERGRFVNRRFPLGEAQLLGGASLGSLNLQTGACKSFRTPIESAHLRADKIVWYVVGDADAIMARLRFVTGLGKRRAVGLGKLALDPWSVEPCETWPGFPVIRDARPLRALPLDAMEPEAAQAFEGYACLMYPYQETWREELCLVPA